MSKAGSVAYNNESMTSLKGAEVCRRRPSTTLGTDDIEGLIHAEFEIISNSADEVREGHSDSVEIYVKKDGEFRVVDHGRGVPMGYNQNENKYNYELVYCQLYASGKYDSSNYAKSEGLNGIGCTAAQFTSEYMTVVSVRDEQSDKDGKIKRVRYEMHFKEGNPVGELDIQEGVDLPTGTDTVFKPDLRVFKGANTIVVPPEVYLDKLRQKAMLLPGVPFHLFYDGLKPITLLYENGISDYVNRVCESRLLYDNIQISGSGNGQDSEENMSRFYDANFLAVINFSRTSPLTEVYHNSANLIDGGSSIDGLRAAICKVIEEVGRETGKFAKNEKVQPKDIDEILVAVLSSECPGDMTSFKHQTKTAINNAYIRRLIVQEVTAQLREWAIKNKAEMEKIISEVILNKKAREKAEAVKRTVLKELAKGIDGMLKAPAALLRCTSNVPSECSIYIVEGRSAQGNCHLARDKKTQALLPLRGKIMNCLKESLENILKSEVIRLIIQSLGCGVELKSKYLKDLPPFDLSKLNFHKIIIATDADDDGFHIRCLIIVMIYRLMPSLIKGGYVYIAETPLFELRYGKDIREYAYNIAERDELVKKLENSGVKRKNIKIKRMKGLGESDVKSIKYTTMDKNSRRLIQVQYPEDDTEFKVLANSLMGNDIEGRRNLITAYYDEDFETIDYSGAS